MKFSLQNFLILFCALFLIAHGASAAPLNYEDYPIVKLRALDKITARTQNIEAKVGSRVKFGEVMIDVKACRKPPPIEKKEAAAFLQISMEEKIQRRNLLERNTTPDIAQIFSGWMFASSPALSAMEHPIYDVWVLDCLGRDPEPLPPPEKQAEQAEAEKTQTDEPQAEAPSSETPQAEAPVKEETPQEELAEPTPAIEPTEEPQPTPESAPQEQSEPSVDEILQPEKALPQSDKPQPETEANDETVPPAVDGIY